MGLFDTLYCDYPLPDPEFQNEEFQTKDLECLLDRYRISADGRLCLLQRKISPFEEGIRPKDTEKDKDINYHGEICFYSVSDHGSLEYCARFTHGALEWIRRAGEPEPVSTDSLLRLARDAEVLEKDRQERLEELLQRLEQLHPEVAKRTVEVFDDRADAALWLVTIHPALGELSPYEELARGRHEAVLDALGRLQHGLCS